MTHYDLITGCVIFQWFILQKSKLFHPMQNQFFYIVAKIIQVVHIFYHVCSSKNELTIIKRFVQRKEKKLLCWSKDWCRKICKLTACSSDCNNEVEELGETGDLVITVPLFFSSPDLFKHCHFEMLLTVLRLGLMSKQIRNPTGTTCGGSFQGNWKRLPTLENMQRCLKLHF